MPSQVVAFSPPAEVALDAVTAPFWEGLRDGVLTVQRCAECERFRMPPSLYCPNCRSTAVEWPKLSGRGVLYSYTVTPLAPRESGSPVFVPALVCPIEVESVRIFSNIVLCALEDIQVGMPLKLVRPVAGHDIALFAPA